MNGSQKGRFVDEEIFDRASGIGNGQRLVVMARQTGAVIPIRAPCSQTGANCEQNDNSNPMEIAQTVLMSVLLYHFIIGSFWQLTEPRRKWEPKFRVEPVVAVFSPCSSINLPVTDGDLLSALRSC